MMLCAVRSTLRFFMGTTRARVAGLAVIYTAVFGISLCLAYALRFDFRVPPNVGADVLTVWIVALGLKLSCMSVFRQFDGLLSYFSTPDLRRLVGACACGSMLVGVGWLFYGIELAPPRGVIVLDFILSVVALTATRLGFRNLRVWLHHGGRRTQRPGRRIGIVGAGDAGASLVRELLASPWNGLAPVAFFDDYRHTHSSAHGIPVVGPPEKIRELREKLELDEIVIAMPSAPARRIREVVALVSEAGLACRTVPTLAQLATGRVNVSNLRTVRIEDLLGREPVSISDEAVRGILADRVVMVTGAGGSIGSELCRQILSFNPAMLLLVERSEPNLFVIEQELRGAPNADSAIPVIGDITNRERMREIFRRFKPQVVFHAAAHKHVPMMESQPDEAIRNNVLGSALLAEAAIDHNVERFVLISTDKAVNPTSVMGATKRIAEMYLQSRHTREHHTKFMAVRFGNVLGSSGSVVPTFARQIAAGGPVTVTHPGVTRFFMTIPEAVTLVLQSAALGRGGDIFMLQMGNAVSILDLARQMIVLSGLRPDEDIEIQFTGLRPGEKLHEELSHGGEQVEATEHGKIKRLVSPPLHYSYVNAFVSELAATLQDGDVQPKHLKMLLAKIVPEYTPDLGANRASGECDDSGDDSLLSGLPTKWAPGAAF